MALDRIVRKLEEKIQGIRRSSADSEEDNVVERMEGAMEDIPEVTKENIDKATQLYWDKHLLPQLASVRALTLGADRIERFFHPDNLEARYPFYAQVTSRLFDRALENNPSPLVVFTGGGPGSGKSTTAKFLEHQTNVTIFDSNFSQRPRAEALIHKVRAAGKTPFVFGILPNIDATISNVYKRERAEKGKKILPEIFEFGHRQFPAVIRGLLQDGILKYDEVVVFDCRDTCSFEDVQKVIQRTDFPQRDLSNVLKSVNYDPGVIERRYRAYANK